MTVFAKCGIILTTTYSRISYTSEMDVTQIRFVIFDVGQTLLFLTPSSEEVLLARCHQLQSQKCPIVLGYKISWLPSL